MAKIIVWNKKAQVRFDCIIDYLQKEWSESVAENFVKSTHFKLSLLSKFPYIGRKSAKKHSVSLFNLSKHNQMFYRIEGNKIIIITIFVLRRDSAKKPF